MKEIAQAVMYAVTGFVILACLIGLFAGVVIAFVVAKASGHL